jgi:hypothetical protein
VPRQGTFFWATSSFGKLIQRPRRHDGPFGGLGEQGLGLLEGVLADFELLGESLSPIAG